MFCWMPVLTARLRIVYVLDVEKGVCVVCNSRRMCTLWTAVQSGDTALGMAGSGAVRELLTAWTGVCFCESRVALVQLFLFSVVVMLIMCRSSVAAGDAYAIQQGDERAGSGACDRMGVLELIP